MRQDLVTLAPELRRIWFATVAGQLEEAFPDAWQALSMAAVELTYVGQLEVKVPAPYPRSREVKDEVRAVVDDVLTEELPEGLVYELTFTKADPSPRRRKASGLDVHHWGDPPPEEWPRMTEELLRGLAALGGPPVTVGALSQQVLWLQFPTQGDRKAVGTTPGAAYALKTVTDRWSRDHLVVLYP